MVTYLLLARLILAGVFGIAGLAKLADRRGSERALAGFGVPGALVRPLSWLLPIAELATALALLPVPTAWPGAVGAAILLVAFLLGIVANLARGRHPECHCFGQISPTPIGRKAIVRNLALLALALAVILAGPRDVGPRGIDRIGVPAPGQLFGVVVAVLGLGLLALVLHELRARRGRSVHLDGSLPSGGVPHDAAYPPENSPRPPGGLPRGAAAPSFCLPDLQGTRWSLEDLLSQNRPLVLLFVDAGCGPCAALFPDIARWQRSADGFGVVVISRGAPELNRERAREHGLTTVLLQDDREVSRAYRAPTTPAALTVGADGRIASELAEGANAVRALAARVVGPMPAALVDSSAELRGDVGLATPKLASTARPVPHPELTEWELDGQAVIYDARNGQVHQFNPTATLIWSLCDGEHTVATMADVVSESYLIPRDQARADVAELLASLHAADLLATT